MVTVRLPHHVGSAAAARRRVRQELQERAVSRRMSDDAALVVSELVGNAVRHAQPLPGGQLMLSCTVQGSEVELRVTDGGADLVPALRAPADDESAGRGLTIVSRLAAAWGVESSAVGTTVWAVLKPGRGAGHARPQPA
ncbi:MAG: ATP-binding protein [Actinomycetota bacterium]|nr:ATP-binding protein [Actinomycetota bacterium]